MTLKTYFGLTKKKKKKKKHLLLTKKKFQTHGNIQDLKKKLITVKERKSF